MGNPVDLVQGTLDLLILKALDTQPLHGWVIAQRITDLSRTDKALYAIGTRH